LQASTDESEIDVIRKQLAILLLVLAAAPAGAWWNSSGNYRKPLTIGQSPATPHTA
jgi:hypothetical protein